MLNNLVWNLSFDPDLLTAVFAGRLSSCDSIPLGCIFWFWITLFPPISPECLIFGHQPLSSCLHLFCFVFFLLLDFHGETIQSFSISSPLSIPANIHFLLTLVFSQDMPHWWLIAGTALRDPLFFNQPASALPRQENDAWVTVSCSLLTPSPPPPSLFRSIRWLSSLFGGEEVKWHRNVNFVQEINCNHKSIQNQNSLPLLRFPGC